MRCIDEEIPFEVPSRWEWCRLGVIADIIGGYAFPSQSLKSNEGIRVIRISDINEAGFINTRLVRYKGPAISDSFRIQLDDILMAMTGGTVGKSLYVTDLPEEMLLNQRVAIISNKWIVSEYLNLVVKAPHIISIINERKNSTNDNISMVDIYNFLVPLPPIKHQRLIVSRYHELLPGIEKYGEAQQKLDCLNAEIRERTRKSILQEAIMGRLVSQEITDEPVSTLLDHIRKEKESLLKKGELKKKDIVDSIIFKGEDNKYYENVDSKFMDISDDIPFDIPETWAWVRLGSIVSNEAGLAYSKDCLADKTAPLIRVLRGGNIEEGRWIIKDDDVIISKKYVKESLLLKRGTFITPAVTSIERMAKTALIEEDQNNIVVGGFVLMIKPFITDDSLLQYLNLFFQTTYFKKYCISITNKSGQAFYNLSRQKLMQCLVPLPPMGEQIRIAIKYSSLTL